MQHLLSFAMSRIGSCNFIIVSWCSILVGDGDIWLRNLDGSNKRAPFISEEFTFRHNENLQCQGQLCSPHLHREAVGVSTASQIFKGKMFQINPFFSPNPVDSSWKLMRPVSCFIRALTLWTNGILAPHKEKRRSDSLLLELCSEC